MREDLRAAALCVLCLGLVVGCGNGDDGGDRDGGPGDGGAMIDASDPGTDDGGVVPDAAVLGARGSACGRGDECESGLCLDALALFDLGTGYCTIECADDTDCATDDGYQYRCVATSGTPQCVRTCTDGFGCPETDACLNDWDVGGTRADICVDLAADRCTGDGDCEGSDYCMPAIADRERVHVVCFTPLGNLGTPRTSLLRVGATCDPRSNVFGNEALPCSVTSDCPDGWLCNPRQGDSRRVCHPPDEEACAWFCGIEGLCHGICDADDDCPSNMRCGLYQRPALTQGTPSPHDDAPWEFGICEYAAGSRTPCTRESDCAATGAGGSREVCKVGANAAGEIAPICVTPLTGVAVPGEACGDDRTTDAYEVRPCLGICAFDRCAGLCETAADCASGAECVEVAIDVDGRTRFCAEPPTCTRDGDCASGEVCRPGGTGLALRDFCSIPDGTLAPGATCELGDYRFFGVSERCGFGCADVGEGPTAGRCTSICAVDSDCPTDFVCSQARFTINGFGTPEDRTDDAVGQRGLCLYAPGSHTSCTTDGACPSDERCAHLIDSTGTEQRWCLTAVTGGVAPGGACVGAALCENRAGCFSDWFDPGDRYCTALCDSDADCPSSLVCRRFAGTPDPDVQPALCLRPEDPRGLPL